MARSLAADLDVKRGDLLRIWPADLVVDPDKRGRAIPPTREQVEEKLASMLLLGQLQPCPATITHDKRLELSAGFTRWEALMLHNGRCAPEDKRRIEVKVIDANAEESFLANIAENRQRNVTTVIDDAHNIRRLTEKFHKTDEEICAIYAENGKPMSASWLENMRSLTRLDREHQEGIHYGHLNASVGYLLATIDPKEREAVLKDAADEGKGKVTTTSVVKAARKRKVLTGTQSLRVPELKSTFQYLKEKDNNPRVRQLASAFLQFQAGTIVEADFFAAIHASVT